MCFDEKKEINKRKDTIDDLISLPFKVKKNCLSQDPLFPITNLFEGNNQNNGWVSEKFCSYPQKMVIKFDNYVAIKQINIIINETKIPKVIQFISCINNTNNNNNEYNKYEYINIGFISLSSNKESNFKEREMRKIPVKISNTKRIKLLIHENYVNSFNPYNQVGIISIEFFGNFINEENNNNFIRNNIYYNRINEESNENDEEEDEEEEEEEEEENKNETNEKGKFCFHKNENKNFFNEIYKNGEYGEEGKVNEQDEEDNESDENKEKNEINDEIQNNDDNSDDKKNFQNKIDKNINKVEIKKENTSKKNMEIMITEKKKEIIDEIQKKKIIKDYNNTFKRFQDEINELKAQLNKIYKLKSFKESEQKNNNEFYYSPNKNINYLKLKTINEKNLFFNHNKMALSPLSKINSLKANEDNKSQRKETKLIKTFKILKKRNSTFNNDLTNDNPVLLSIKLKNNNDIDINNLSNEDSLDYSIQDIKKEPLEELSSEIREKNIFLINILGEEIIRKIFSKNVYYKNDGFNALNLRVNDIIVFSPQYEEESKNYLASLMKIFFLFIDDKNSSVVLNCIELLRNIIKAIKEKNLINKIKYDYRIEKSIINKIIEKFNHNSKRIRKKASQLYCYILDSNFCEPNSLLIDLIQNEVNEYFYKLNSINKNNYASRLNSARSGIGMSRGMGYLISINKNTIIEKMNIFFDIFSFPEKFKLKFNKNKFPKTIIGDFIIMNMNSPKEEVREITKNVLIKYIKIFGNQIFYKMKMIVGNKDLSKIIQDNDELKIELIKYENEKNKKEKDTKLLFKTMSLKKKKN